MSKRIDTTSGPLLVDIPYWKGVEVPVGTEFKVIGNNGPGLLNAPADHAERVRVNVIYVPPVPPKKVVTISEVGVVRVPKGTEVEYY